MVDDTIVVVEMFHFFLSYVCDFVVWHHRPLPEWVGEGKGLATLASTTCLDQIEALCSSHDF